MNDKKNIVLKNSVLYSFASIITKAMGFIMLPLYTSTKYILTTEYGEYGLMSQFVALAVFFVSFSMNHAAIRFYYDFKEDEKKVQRFFGTIISFSFILGIFVLLVFTIFHKQLTNILFTGIPYFPNVFFAVITTVFYAIYNLYQGFLQSMQEGGKFSRNGILFVLLHVVLNIVFLVGFRNVSVKGYSLGGVNGMMLSLMFSYAAFAIYGIYDLLKKKIMVICIDKELLQMTLKYSLPLIPHSLANNMASYIPKVFLNKIDKLPKNALDILAGTYTAIHSVAMQFSSIIDIVQAAVNSAQKPWFNEKMNHGDEGKKEIIDFIMTATKATNIICAAVGLFSQEIILLIAQSDAYYEAWKIVPVLAIVHAIKCIYYNHTLAIMYDLKANKKIFLCSGIGSSVNFIFTGIFVWWVFDFNIWGAAFAFLISRCVSTALSIVVCRKHNIIKYPLKKMILCVLKTAVTLVIGMIPVNLLYYMSTGKQIELFSGWFFLNFAIKIIVFMIGSLTILGNQREEIADFVKQIFENFKNRKKVG